MDEMEHIFETELDKKLEVLKKLGKALNLNHIVWAVGASLLLYLKGIADEFHDIDIMVAEDDAHSAKEILSYYGLLQPPKANSQYRTKYFLEFIIEGVEIDMMAGFTIVQDKREYYFPLLKENIREYMEIGHVQIPLQSVEEWYRYYKLMGRMEKVKMIEEACRLT